MAEAKWNNGIKTIHVIILIVLIILSLGITYGDTQSELGHLKVDLEMHKTNERAETQDHETRIRILERFITEHGILMQTIKEQLDRIEDKIK